MIPVRWLALGFSVLILACGADVAPPATAWVGATIWDGTGSPPVEDGVLLVLSGRIEAVGPADAVDVPRGAERVDVTGRWVIPGLVNAHGHVGGSGGELPEAERETAILRELALYARYGVTTVNSLGGDGPTSVRIRDAQSTPELDRARLFVAGTVVTGATPDEAVGVVDANLALGVDRIKIRVDDNLGTTSRMSPEVYRAVIDRAHMAGRPVAAHLFYLDDAKDLLRTGADLVAHSVRDRDVDDELASLLRERGVCYVPTLMREVSTFVYAERPGFFDDPFFLAHADSAEILRVSDPEFQQGIRDSRSAARYREALDVASRNLRALSEAGVTIAMGTDTGPPGRFQGYFEHLEMERMAAAGLDAAAVLEAATGDAAACLGASEVGTLEPGKWADFVVLRESPLADIRGTRSIESVWIAGNRVPGSGTGEVRALR